MAPGMEADMRIALAQASSTPSLETNLAIIEEMTLSAANQGAELVVLPEAMMRCFGAPLHPIAETVGGPWAESVRAIARKHGVTVIAGMFTPADGKRVRNTLLVTGPDVEASYDKIHLFDAFGFSESDMVAPGITPTVVDIGGTRIGLATCYDVRFPGLFIELARAGAEAIVVCASWGAGPGKIDQWKLLTRARALDCTSFVLAVDQADPADPAADSAAPTGVGHSAAISPWGEVVGELDTSPGLLLVDLDLAQIGEARAAIPVLVNERRLTASG
jgi:predicted amidohydrolase